jgi:hypothetical protein
MTSEIEGLISHFAYFIGVEGPCILLIDGSLRGPWKRLTGIGEYKHVLEDTRECRYVAIHVLNNRPTLVR